MSGSMFFSLYLDIKRGLRDKRFWGVLGFFSFIFFLCIVLDWIRPLTQYYGGGAESYKYYPVGGYTALSEVSVLNGLEIFCNFFPFACAAAFAYVIMDDRKQGYCMQQIQRTGFTNYYWGKLAASGVLGGIFGAFCMVAACLLSLLFIDYLPFFREAVEQNAKIYAVTSAYEAGDAVFGSIGWSGYREYVSLAGHPWAWNFLAGGTKYFVMGALYGLLAGIIAFCSDNRVVLYAGPVIFLIMWDGLVYMFDRLAEPFSRAATVINKFHMREHVTMFGDLYHYSLLLFLVFGLFCLADRLRNRTECRYMEGGLKNG